MHNLRGIPITLYLISMEPKKGVIGNTAATLKVEGLSAFHREHMITDRF